jgi:O-antigen ligase
MLFGLCCADVLLAIVFGGGTHRGYFGDVVAQLASIPLLCAAFWSALDHRHDGRGSTKKLGVVVCGAAVLLIAQIMPLPLGGWRGPHFLSDETVTLLPADWRTVSLAPDATWAAAASMIVPVAVFGAVMELPAARRMVLCQLLAATGIAALLLGFLQVLQGPNSPLRFYDFTNRGEPVGFFANRNHFAVQLSITLIFCVMLLASKRERLERHLFGSRTILWFSVALAVLVALLAGVVLTRSRAGMILAMAALAGSVFLTLMAEPRRATAQWMSKQSKARNAMVAALVFALLFAAEFGLGGLLSRFQHDPIRDLRLSLNRTTWDAVWRTFPAGTGLGSFVPVYSVLENPKDVFVGYANRAHNDYAELALETGAAGMAAFFAFLIWVVRRTYAVWCEASGEPDASLLMERAATLVAALLLAHSLVDYPLRTAALSTIFAVSCGMLAARPPLIVSTGNPEAQPPRRRRPAASAGEKWGATQDWPSAWQKKQ